MPRRVPVAFLACLVGFVGCSSAEYDQAFNKQLAIYRRQAEFAELQPRGSSVTPTIRVRAPVVLTTQLDATAAAEDSRPPFIRDYPGYAAAFTAKLKDSANVSFPAVLTVGVVPTTDQRPADVKAKILDQVKLDGSFADMQWQSRTVKDLAGTEKPWDVLDLTGPQVFTTDANGLLEDKQWPGTCQVWVSTDPAQEAVVILTWRVPQALAAQVAVERLAPLVAITLETGQ